MKKKGMKILDLKKTCIEAKFEAKKIILYVVNLMEPQHIIWYMLWPVVTETAT